MLENIEGGTKLILQAMLFKRWKKAFRGRHTGADHKLLMGAVVKAMVLSAWRKGSISCQVCAIKLNESEELKKHR